MSIPKPLLASVIPRSNMYKLMKEVHSLFNNRRKGRSTGPFFKKGSHLDVQTMYPETSLS